MEERLGRTSGTGPWLEMALPCRSVERHRSAPGSECAPGEWCTMMENWVADSKRGPLQHAPEGSAATLNKRRVRRCDKRHPATHWETPERVAHTTLRTTARHTTIVDRHPLLARTSN